MERVIPPRHSLPNRRRNNTFKVQVPYLNRSMLVSVGYYADGAPGEVFVSDIKAGSGMDATARDAAVLLSIGLQFGIPLDTMQGAVTRNGDGSPSSVMGVLIDKLVTERPPGAPDAPVLADGLRPVAPASGAVTEPA